MNLSSLFGSDVFVRYTAVYSWNSNQMAHAMMGFCGATLMVYGFAVLGAAPVWALTFAIIPILKDLTDYLADIEQESSVFKLTQKYLREMRQDGLTDNLFWNTGAVLAVLVAVAQEGKDAWFWALLVLLAVMLGVVFVKARPHYEAEKRRFDDAALPFFFRLPNFTGNPVAVRDVAADGSGDWREGRAEAVRAIEAFAYNDSREPAHMVIDGVSGTRKTPLAVGIGSGATVQGVTVRFMTQSTLVEEIQAGQPQMLRADTEPLDPREAGLLILDDIASPLTPDMLPTWLTGMRTVWVTSGGEHAEQAVRELRGRLIGPVQVVRLDTPDPAEALSNKQPSARLRASAFASLASGVVLLGGSLVLILFG